MLNISYIYARDWYFYKYTRARDLSLKKETVRRKGERENELYQSILHKVQDLE